MVRSIELGWVARFDKSLPLPELIFESNDDFSGRYFSPHYSEELIGNHYRNRRRGIIVISTDYCEHISENIAHEWRHHWQVFHGWNIQPAFRWNRPTDYDAAIVRYFTENPMEADALRFQRKRVGCNDHWVELLSAAGFEFGF